MIKRRFFLLEVVIALALVVLFAVYFLRSSLNHLYKERETLLDLEFQRKADLIKMELLQQGWPDGAKFGKGIWIKKPIEVVLDGRCYQRVYSYQLYSPQQNEQGYRLTVKERVVTKRKVVGVKSYNFFANKA